MADIKTRDVVKGTIKKIDKAAIAADRMRSAYVQTKEKAEHATRPDEHNAEEYASDRKQNNVINSYCHREIHPECSARNKSKTGRSSGDHAVRQYKSCNSKCQDRISKQNTAQFQNLIPQFLIHAPSPFP